MFLANIRYYSISVSDGPDMRAYGYFQFQGHLEVPVFTDIFTNVDSLRTYVRIYIYTGI